ncbi:MAG: LemA family protein [Planctomycetota bacterium]|nr:MAG: LemA family protein [Planctomycetota bacterium]
MTGLWIALAIAAIAVAYFIVLYNGLIAARNDARNAWAQIDVQLKRRHDLVPNLVAAVKGYMQHERGTLELLVAARNQAAEARGPAAQGAAEGALSGVLARFLAVVEAYPDLKANANFRALQEELASTENRIAFARQAYNDEAARYNTRRETFPARLISGGFQKAEYFELENRAQAAVPPASF